MAINETTNIRSLSGGNWYWMEKAIIQHHARAVGVFGIAVYNCLAFYAGSDQTCYPSQGRIAQILGCSRATVNRAIKLLETNGLIRVVRRGSYPQLYYLLKARCSSDNALLSTTATSDVTDVAPNNNKVSRIINNVVSVTDVDNDSDSIHRIPQEAIENEALALEIAEVLDDRQNLHFYISCCRKYPESLLREVIREAARTPAHKIRKSCQRSGYTAPVRVGRCEPCVVGRSAPLAVARCAPPAVGWTAPL